MNDILFRKAEAMLYNYNRNKTTIKNLKLKLEILKNNYRGIGSISYGEKSGITNKINNCVEDEIIKRDEEIRKLENEIRLKEIEIELIDNIMNDNILEKVEMFIIEEKYFKGNFNKNVAISLHISEQTLCKYKNELINKVIPLLV